jgi:NADP-dependent 3-hydroxy acid dehydrogenase YdfG
MTSTAPVIVITGASAGVGRAVTRGFARRGARLGLLARGRAGLDAAKADAERLGALHVATVAADVADAAHMEAAAAKLEAELGPPEYGSTTP